MIHKLFHRFTSCYHTDEEKTEVFVRDCKYKKFYLVQKSTCCKCGTKIDTFTRPGH